ncbi:tetratricopeptide repeat protein [Cytophagaceae bacterium YF14B1]|uniref:Tetratricopeptide repeat protein n=1 Tax=Xanthocytophaga flava TaxID=3048013 RepID=A0AAE3UCL3_9BACT|nr:tetratricopeptide repeat protein [Xanthocytophaga flavus]MDJ1484924.1 tetratricopeptide repeat protein [Xanthocytophaga flavus]
MPKTLLLLLTLLSYITTSACANEYHVLLNGQKIETSGIEIANGYDLTNPEQIKQFETDLIKLDSIWKYIHEIKAYSDYGVTLMYLGRYNEAKDVFTAIEKTHPDLYTTASNLGTVYELLGKNDSAYYWIQKGIILNPKSHNGSEWLHLKILEVKLKGLSYLTSQFMLRTDLGNDTIPKSSLTTEELKKLRNHISYQLNERMMFVKAPEPIVAFLLFQLGNLKALTEDVTKALRTYTDAYTYGYRSVLLAKRYLKFKQLHKDSNTKLDKDALTDQQLQVMLYVEEDSALASAINRLSSFKTYLSAGILLLGLSCVYIVFRNKV